MASFLDDAASAIAEAAGWRQPTADKEGIYSFFLQGGQEMRLFSPDGGNTLVFCSTVQTLPDDARAREELLQAQAQRAVAAAKERKSILALEEEVLILHRMVTAKVTGLAELPGIAEEFLNDLDWWKAQAARLSA